MERNENSNVSSRRRRNESEEEELFFERLFELTRSEDSRNYSMETMEEETSRPETSWTVHDDFQHLCHRGDEGWTRTDVTPTRVTRTRITPTIITEDGIIFALGEIINIEHIRTVKRFQKMVHDMSRKLAELEDLLKEHDTENRKLRRQLEMFNDATPLPSSHGSLIRDRPQGDF